MQKQLISFLSAAALLLFAVPTSQAAALSSTKAAHAQAVLDGFGVNTHIDFQKHGYENISQTINDINYLGGVKILRDSPGSDQDYTWWPQVAAATGAKFDAYIGEGGTDLYQSELARMQKMAAQGSYLFSVEGGNEEDDSYAVQQQNSVQFAAQFQPILFASAAQLRLPVFNISFGAGWCVKPNDPDCLHGDYNTVGDLSAYTTFANAHTYPEQSPNGNGTFVRLNTDAQMAASTRPSAITEFGWTTSAQAQQGWGNVSESTQAAYTLDGIFDAFELGNPYYFSYALYDDDSGTFGLFSTSNQPKQSAKAVHDLFALLTDKNSSANTFTPGSLSYTVSGLPVNVGGMGGHQLLLQKSDGTYWLALWNEQPLNALPGNADLYVPPVTVTLTLAQAANVRVYDPMSGTSALQTNPSAQTVQISLPAHPILVEIGEPVSAAPAPASGGTTGTGSAPAGVQANAITVGSRVETTDILRVRASASLSALSYGFTTLHELGTVLGGPVVADGYTWWQVQYDGGLTGWSAGSYLELVSSGTAASESGTSPVLSPQPAPAPTPAPSPAPAPSPSTPQTPPVQSPSVPASDIPAVDTPSISAPGAASVLPIGKTSIQGVSVTDPFGAKNPGDLALLVSVSDGGSVYLTDANGASVDGSGSQNVLFTGTLDQINAVTKTLAYTPGVAISDSVTVTVYNQAGISAAKKIAITVSEAATDASSIPTPQHPVVTVPTSLSAYFGQQNTVAGISVADPFAAVNPGTLAFDVNVSSGTVSLPGATGSGSQSLMFVGTLAQLNAAVKALTYLPGTVPNDAITITVYNQAGLSTTQTIPVTALTAPSSSPIPTPTNPVLAAPTNLSASIGHMIAVSGVSVTDPFAALNPGTLALRIYAQNGALSAPGMTGNGSMRLSLDAPLTSVNSALAGLSYTGSSLGRDTITVTVYNQAGLSTTKNVAVSVSS